MTANSLVVIDAEQFFTRLEETLERKLKERLEGYKSQEPADSLPEWMTRRDVSNYFKICLASVDNLTRTGILKKHYLGGLPRFNRDEVKAAFTAWQKYQRGNY